MPEVPEHTTTRPPASASNSPLPMPAPPNTERLAQDASREKHWKRWGPYLSERQWATVREDYSPDGNVWDYFPHNHARSRVYRWGEDGLLGFTDRECRMCLGVALWNGQDDILKERLFGLTGHQGNHGEDVKESYYYLDSTPTHSYAKALYRYPQGKFPYAELVKENGRRGKKDLEYELEDTGAFDEEPLLRRGRRVRQGRLRRPGHPLHRHQPRPRRRAAAHPAQPVVPQRLELGQPARERVDQAQSPTRTPTAP